jgi:hypothetical protein
MLEAIGNNVKAYFARGVTTYIKKKQNFVKTCHLYNITSKKENKRLILFAYSCPDCYLGCI